MATFPGEPLFSQPPGIAVRVAPSGFLGDIQSRLLDAGVIDAVRHHENAPIFDWAMGLLSLQGISDRAAIAFRERHGRIAWTDVQLALRDQHRQCPRLCSWWHFICGYRKSTQTCAEPRFISSCALPRHAVRKGTLAQAAFGFALFIRDICDGDLVAWIDERVAMADKRAPSLDRGRLMGDVILKPLAEIPGTGPKVWSLVLADLLLGADPDRKLWVAAGASLIVVDSLTHNFLHRTGTLRSYSAEHPYGPRCYLPGGCREVIDRIAQDVDASNYDPDLPSYCPRFVQHALWYFCAEGGWNICNGRQIDDRHPCRQPFCPAGPGCARLALFG